MRRMVVTRGDDGGGAHLTFGVTKLVFFLLVQRATIAELSAMDAGSKKQSKLVSHCTQRTVIQDTLKIGQKYSTVLRARERVSERASAAERARSKQAARSIAIE